jgi:HEAT repeat protein
MSPRPTRLQRGLAAAAALALLLVAAPSAHAQLRLPRKDRARPVAPPSGGARPRAGEGSGERGNLAPHLVCGECATRNYTAPLDRPQPDGSYLAWCTICEGDRPHRRSEDRTTEERVGLPTGRSVPLPTPPTDGGLRQRGGISSSEVRYGDTAAGFILREVAASEEVNSSLVEKAVESLLGLGEEGLVTSRIVLHDSSAPVVVVAGRVLVRAGQPEDAERVVMRLRGQMPGRSGALVLEELVERNPVHGSPELLIELLEHPQKPVRLAARRLLDGKVGPEHLPQLERVLVSRRTETRVTALELIEDIDDPAVLDLLLRHLDDRSSRVAGGVIDALAGRSDERIEPELLARALPRQFLLRENAYALLAIVAREDVQLRPMLDDRHAPPLLEGLKSSDPVVRGASAAALAGIGYRSAQPFATGWLDREVMATMIHAVSGREFHPDFTALQPRVLARLRLLSGEDLGTDGPGWVRWWVDHRNGYYARRAYLAVPPDGVGLVEAHLRGSGDPTGNVSLLGSGAWTNEARERAGAAEKLVLTDRECRDLVALLEREGVLGPERQPGVRGARGTGERELEVVLDGRGKRFVFGRGRGEAWFERVVAAVRDLRERNRWQRFPNPVLYDDQFAFWEAESGWWSAERTESERALRLKELVLTSVKALPPSQRNVALRELGRVYEVEGVASREDFELLMDLLRDEGFFAQRAELLVDLLLAAGAPEPGTGAPTDARMQPELGAQVIDLLVARFPRGALPAVGRVARACGKETLYDLARGPRPILRAVAAGELATAPDEEGRALLVTMLEDPEPVVEAAAVSALGAARVEEARTELLLRARLAQPMVRSAALRAIGRLGGEYVLESLVLGVSDPDPEVKRGAAEGLAALGDAAAAPLLISLLRQDRSSETYAIARQGLVDLGDEARPDLLRVVESPTHAARRECALLLGAMLAPEVVTAMISMLEVSPDDAELGFELAVLSCVDHRGAPDPARAWADWYAGVTHGDGMNWFLAALERRGVSIPASANFQGGPGGREAALLLADLLESDEDFLAERARRELGRMLGTDLGAMPRGEAERSDWLTALRETVLERFQS